MLFIKVTLEIIKKIYFKSTKNDPCTHDRRMDHVLYVPVLPMGSSPQKVDYGVSENEE